LIQQLFINSNKNELMDILIFGASGATGHQLVKQALSNSHSVLLFSGLTAIISRADVADFMLSQDVVIVGAGHAGLSLSYHLKQFGLKHIVFERGCIGNSWRNQR
jgi:nucleoside-diphosphate-sugar epimerase